MSTAHGESAPQKDTGSTGTGASKEKNIVVTPRKAAAAAGALALVGVAIYAAGHYTGPATTLRGGVMSEAECVDTATVLSNLRNGDTFYVAASDFSVNEQMFGNDIEDVITARMVDGSLLLTDEEGNADEFSSERTRRIVAPDSSFMLTEDDAIVSLEVTQGGEVLYRKVCQQG